MMEPIIELIPDGRTPSLEPTIELIPARAALRDDAATTLDVLVKITTPAAELNAPRPALNLGGELQASQKADGRLAGEAARERHAAGRRTRSLLPRS